MNILHGGKDVVHTCSPLTYHSPMGTIDGSEIGVHLMITYLVDNQHEDLPLVGFVGKILRQDGAETAVVIVALGVSEDNTSKIQHTDAVGRVIYRVHIRMCMSKIISYVSMYSLYYSYRVDCHVACMIITERAAHGQFDRHFLQKCCPSLCSD